MMERETVAITRYPDWKGPSACVKGCGSRGDWVPAEDFQTERGFSALFSWDGTAWCDEHRPDGSGS